MNTWMIRLPHNTHDAIMELLVALSELYPVGISDAVIVETDELALRPILDQLARDGEPGPVVRPEQVSVIDLIEPIAEHFTAPEPVSVVEPVIEQIAAPEPIMQPRGKGKAWPAFCEVCGGPNTRRSLYCSVKCLHKAYNSEKRERRLAANAHICAVCGQKHDRLSNYCSDECKSKEHAPAEKKGKKNGKAAPEFGPGVQVIHGDRDVMRTIATHGAIGGRRL